MSPEFLLGSSVAVFVVLTVVCMGSCAALVGVYLAREWQPARKLLPYALVLVVIDRLLGNKLFGSDLLSATGIAVDAYVILMAALLAYHRVLGGMLAQQYPWMYRQFLIFGWRSVPAGESISRPQ